MNTRRIAWFALATLVAPTELSAQAAIAPGARIRVTAPEIAKGPITGRVSSTDSAAITLVPLDGGMRSERVIPLAAVHRLELYRGRSHSPLKGMGTGLLVGSGAGFLLGVASAPGDGGWVCEGGECVLMGTLGGALWGTVLGGLIGAAIGSPRWEEVAVSRPTVSVLPQADGVAVAVSLSP